MPGFVRDFKSFVTGSLAGSVTAEQGPDIQCSMVNFKALASNAGKVYLGISGVTVAGATTTTTAGWELQPGDETGFLPISNLDDVYRICDNAGDDLVYIAFR